MSTKSILEWKDPNGLRGCGFFHVIEGHIVFQRGYRDRLSFQQSHRLLIPEQQINQRLPLNSDTLRAFRMPHRLASTQSRVIFRVRRNGPQATPWPMIGLPG